MHDKSCQNNKLMAVLLMLVGYQTQDIDSLSPDGLGLCGLTKGIGLQVDYLGYCCLCWKVSVKWYAA